jgi:hypothetical protein
MKRPYVYILIIALLAACQAQPATGTPVPPIATGPVSSAASLTPVQPTPAPPTSTEAAKPSGPVTHVSGSDPNAPNVIVVLDQPVSNGSLTIDSVNAEKAGWLVIYMVKRGQPGHQIGTVAIPSGKSQQVVVPLKQASGVEINPSKLAGQELFVMLQAGGRAPGTPVEVAGESVTALFTVLPASNP